jgi:protein subunit release factor A
MEKDFVAFDREKQEITVRFDDGRNLIIGKNNVDISFFSGGPGGQNVNKNINGVQLIYRIPDGYRRESQKTRQLISRSIAERSQPRNLAQAFSQLAHKVRDYFYIPPVRVKSRTPRKAKERRLENKKYQSYKKESRRKMDY